MHKSPEERYSTPLQVAQALEPFADEYSNAASRDEAQLSRSAPTPASPSLRSNEAKAVSLEAGVSSGAASLAVAQSVGLKTPPDPALDRSEEPEVRVRVASTIRSPESSQGSDPEFPLDLIVSPEPSLTEGLSRTKTRSQPSSSEMSTAGAIQVKLPRSWLWGLSALTVTVLVIVVILALANPFAGTAERPVKQSSEPSIKKVESPPGPPEAAIIVRIDGEKDVPFAANKLFNAIETAMGSHGLVELRNSEPLRSNQREP